MQVGKGQRRGTEDLKQALHQHQWAWCGAWTPKPRDHDLSQSQMLNQMSHPGAPNFNFLTDGSADIKPGMGYTWRYKASSGMLRYTIIQERNR